MSRTPSLSLLVFVFGTCTGLAACDDTGGKSDNSDNSGNGNDGGDGGDGGDVQYEEGCHILDGGQGFAWVNDAIAAASEGATIQLCADASPHEEAIVVNKAVHLIGPGADQLVLSGPINEVPLTISASGASASGFGVDGSRTGILISGLDGGADPVGVAISDVDVVNMPNWGIRVDGATQVTLDSVAIIGNAYGGLFVEGDAEVTLSNAIVQANENFGVTVLGATLHIEDSEVLQTSPSATGATSPGYNLHLDELAEVSSSGTSYADAEDSNIYAGTGSITMSGDLVSGSTVGIQVRQADVDIAETTIENAYAVGLLGDTAGTLVLNAVDIIGDPETSYEEDPNAWNFIEADDAGNITSWPIGGTGLIGFIGDMTWTDSTVTGYHNAGALLIGIDDEAVATIRNVQLIDSERHGLVSGAMNADSLTPDIIAEDLSILSVAHVDDWGDNGACSFVDRTTGFYQSGGRIEWTGGTVSNVGGYGLVNNGGAAQLSGLTIDANACAGIINFFGAARVENGLFTNGGGDGSSALMAAYVDYSGGSTILTGNRFEANRVDYEYESSYTSGDNTYTTAYHDVNGYDVFASSASSVEISDNEFVGGHTAVLFSETTGVLENNVFDDYTGFFGYILSSDLEGASNSFSNGTGRGIYASSSSVELEDTELTGLSLREYTYDSYVNGELVTEGQTTTAYGRAFEMYDSSLSLDGATISDTITNPFYMYSSTGAVYELVDVTLNNVNTDASRSYYGAVYLAGYYGTHDLYLENFVANDIQNDAAIEIFNLNSGSYDGVVTLTIRGAEINNAQGRGMYLYGAGVTADLEDVTINTTGSDGIYAYDGALTLSNVDISGADTSGFVFTNAAVSATTSSATENGSYGMTCSGSTTIDDCDAIDLSLNDLGESLGCEAACGVPL